MDINIIIKHEFTDIQKKALNISSSDELNGWYNYITNNVFINVGSEDFKKKKTIGTFTRQFSKIVAHEVLHSVIYDITKNDNANSTEEKFVELMTGDRRW